MSLKYPNIKVLQRKDFPSYDRTINLQLIEKDGKIFVKIQEGNQVIYILVKDIEKFTKLIKTMQNKEINKVNENRFSL